MGEEPLFSVIMPAYNSERYIGEAIESVIGQTFKQWELIVVDDGSTDGTFDVARAYAARDVRIGVYRQTNAGTAAARNAAIERARGEWLLFLDSDDLLLPECMETYRLLAQLRPEVEAISCDTAVVGKLRRRVRRSQRGLGGIEPVEILRRMLFECVIRCPGVAVKTSTLAVEGLFSTDCYNEDYEMWLRLLRNGVCWVHVGRPLAFWRDVSDSKTRKHGVVMRSSLEVIRSQPREVLEAMGLGSVLDEAIAVWVSRAVVGECQSMVIARDYRTARHHVLRAWRDMVLSPLGAARALAIVLCPGLYRRWLLR